MEPKNRFDPDSLQKIDLPDFDSLLTKKRGDVLESFFHQKPEPKLSKAEKRKRMPVLCEADDVIKTGDRIVEDMRTHGIPAIPFCIHKGKSKSFVVQGEDFKWKVMPIKSYKELMGMPQKEWQALAKLQHFQIPHVGVYVAAPLKTKVRNKIKDELQAMLAKMGNVVSSVCALPIHLMTFSLSAEYKDPVLLARFLTYSRYNLFIEIGRWE